MQVSYDEGVGAARLAAILAGESPASRQQRCYGASGEDNGTIVALANQWSALCHG